jgi:uncharacterized protein YecE (DUF72 family)
MIRIGTSGWVYPHWQGIFYPEDLPSRDWFAFYAEVFDTVEINNTFYRLANAETFDHWRRQAPKGFLYSVKANRFITHMKKLKDPETSVPHFCERAALLGASLGPLLFQLPPHWKVDLARFEAFLKCLPQRRTNVVEFRDQTWIVDDIFEVMERYGVTHCIHDMRPLRIPLRITSDTVYLRFHGDPFHDGGYAREYLRSWAGRIREWSADGLDVYVYFNNDVGGHAIEDARVLRQESAG